MSLYAGSMGWGHRAWGHGPFGHGPWATAPFTSAYPYAADLAFRTEAHQFDDLTEQRYLTSRIPARTLHYTVGRIDSAQAGLVQSWYVAANGGLVRFVAADHRTGVPFVVRFGDAVIGHLRGPGPIRTWPAFALKVSRPVTVAELMAADSPTLWWRLNDLPGVTSVFGVNSPLHGLLTSSPAGATPGVGAAGLLVQDGAAACSFQATSYTLVSETTSTALVTVLGSGAFTCEAWIAPTTVVSDGTHMLGGLAGIADKMNGSSAGFAFGVLNGGVLTARFRTATSSLELQSAPNALVPGQAQHVAVTVDRVNTAAALWLNGALVASASTASLASWAVNSTPVLVGWTSSGAAGPFDGRLQDVALYATAVSSAHFRQRYLVGTQP